MRILLISDIHANLVALDAVLAAAGGYDAIWCLGDLVGYGPAPNECLAKIRALDPICLAGNHDWAVLGKLDVNEFNGDARRAIAWTQEVLHAENLAWLERLPDRRELQHSDVTLVHASPRHPIWEYILSSSLAGENMSYFETPVCFFGHTHVASVFHMAAGQERISAQPLVPGNALLLSAKTLLNPGSVGQPRDRDPRAAYAIFDPEAGSLTPYRVPYDIAATQAQMAQAKLPRRLIERLNYGV